MRATLTIVCAATCLLFGGLMGICTLLTLMAGGGLIQAVLGFIWSAACVVCGLKVLRAPLAPLGRANTEDLARELDQ